MKSISLYVDNGSALTKVHPFTKLMYIAAAVGTPLLLGKLWAFPCAVAVSLLLLAGGGVLKKALPLIAFSFTILLTIFLIHGLFNQRNTEVLFALGPLRFYREGLLYALRIGCNIMNMLLAFAVLVLTTRPAELVEELEKRGFSQRFGYIVTSVFQIVPQMAGTMGTIMDAQRSRGLETEGSLIVRARAFLPLISPVVMSSLINTRERAIALEVRGFGGAGRGKTWLRDREKHRGDRAATVALAVLLAAALVYRVYVVVAG